MTLVLIDDDRRDVVVSRDPPGTARAEHPLRDLVFAHPGILPIRELEPECGRIIPVATEVNLPGAGFIDVLLVTEYGRLIIVECKLWRNPQARREVVGQVLDYARELARYSYGNLQRAVSSRLGRPGNVLYELAAAAGTPLGEAAFVDRVSRYLQQLCKHWSQNMAVDFDARNGKVVFPKNARGADWPGEGLFTLAAGEIDLTCRIEATSAGQLEGLKGAVQHHLDRFAFRKGELAYDWKDD